MNRKTAILCATVAVACAVGHRLHAQSTSATLAGDVIDPSGAVIAGAEVVLTLPASGQRRTATTRGDGRFAIAGLDPGTYDVEVVAPGFAPTRMEHCCTSARRTSRTRPSSSSGARLGKDVVEQVVARLERTPVGTECRPRGRPNRRDESVT